MKVDVGDITREARSLLRPGFFFLAGSVPKVVV